MFIIDIILLVYWAFMAGILVMRYSKARSDDTLLVKLIFCVLMTIASCVFVYRSALHLT